MKQSSMGKLKDILLGSKEFKNASWLIAGRVIHMLLAFVISIFTTRYLGPASFGTINYATAFVAFFTSLCTLGINSVIIKDFVDNPNDQGKTIGTTLFLRLISSALSAIMIVTIVFFVDYGERETLLVTALCSAALIFQTADTINYWFQAQYKSKVTAIATLAAYIATATYRIVLLIFQKDVYWFAFATSVDYIFVAIFLFAAYKKYHGPKLSVSLSKGKYLLSKSYHYILSGMMVAIYGQVDKFMLKQMMDETVVGYYSLASSINLMWVFVLQAIIDSMYPTIISSYKQSKEEFNKKNRQLYMIVIYVSIFVAIMFVLFGKLFIRIIYGEAYLPAAEPLKIVTWYTIFSYLGVARNAWIVCENKQKYLKYMYFSAAVINVILNYFMIPVWGASGAALASLITQICTSILLPICIKDLRPNVKLMAQAFVFKGIK